METNTTVWIAEDDHDEREQMLEAVHDAACPVNAQCFDTRAQLMDIMEEQYTNNRQLAHLLK
jgi:hypothetical protein